MVKKRIDIFVERFNDAIESSGLRPTDLAEKTGISTAMISQYMHGKAVPKTERLNVIARVLGVSSLYLLGFEDKDGSLTDEEGLERTIYYMLARLSKEEQTIVLKQIRALVDDK